MIEIFSTPTCHFCNEAKEFFKAHEVAYTDFDVSADADKKKEMLEATGKLGVPQIRIDGDWYIGFNAERLTEILKERKLLS